MECLIYYYYHHKPADRNLLFLWFPRGLMHCLLSLQFQVGQRLHSRSQRRRGSSSATSGEQVSLAVITGTPLCQSRKAAQGYPPSRASTYDSWHCHAFVGDVSFFWKAFGCHLLARFVTRLQRRYHRHLFPSHNRPQISASPASGFTRSVFYLKWRQSYSYLIIKAGDAACCFAGHVISTLPSLSHYC